MLRAAALVSAALGVAAAPRSPTRSSFNVSAEAAADAAGAAVAGEMLMFAGGIIFFSFFYTAIMFDPKDVADNLKRQGAYVPGIRPGQQTAKYIDDVITRLTVFGALYVTSVCLLPEFMIVAFNITFQLGGTALLIVVVVAMDFMSQVQSHLMSSQYAKLMEKSNLKGYGRNARVR